MRELVNLSNRTIEEQIEFNDKLFSLYAKLVGPLTALENLYIMKNTKEKHIKQQQNFNLNCGGLFLYAFVMFILFIVYSIFISVFFDLEEDMAYGVWWIICIALTFLILFVENRIRANRRKTLQNELDTVNEQIADIYTMYSEQFQFIPPSYFNRSAVAYFSQAYYDGKVSNLKEAMESYDLYLHRKTMETGQIQILNQQQQILNNQRTMRQELAFDTAMLLLSKF